MAAETGFGTAANFRSIFRREVGVTPSAYRKAYGASPPPDAGEPISFDDQPGPARSAGAKNSSDGNVEIR
ncbi:AraC family transcriptional regulator [Streptomyces sp. NPDC050844]|uniref:AraC family transcriptional regulator n=1 Tax=Streptomyces sp. NPDC050844 TaxID=3155790 RepID=UPI0033D35A09